MGTRDLPSLNENSYDLKSSGPFDVIIQKASDNSTSNTSPIDPLAVGRLLYFTKKMIF